MSDIPDPSAAVTRALDDGDARALDELVVALLPRLEAYVHLKMGPGLRQREGSADVVQSVCREALEGLRDGPFEFRGRAAFLSWLFTTALNKIRERDRFNRRQRRAAARELPATAIGSAAGHLVSPSRKLMAQEELARVEHVFGTLSERDQEIIILARVMGLARTEIAELLGCTAAAARVRLGRAVARLGAALANAEGDALPSRAPDRLRGSIDAGEDDDSSTGARPDSSR